ncbi:hypothetical protein XENTR_v10000175 [Xenopus tropicalis]|nr:hypothetical protein XENTR_v10000175 [Xenopus tropicalis]
MRLLPPTELLKSKKYHQPNKTGISHILPHGFLNWNLPFLLVQGTVTFIHFLEVRQLIEFPKSHKAGHFFHTLFCY